MPGRVGSEPFLVDATDTAREGMGQTTITGGKE
jgi:hypothetical protein